MSHLSHKEFKEVNSALVPHIECGLVNAVNARKLHTFLGVGRDFSNWIKQRIEKYGFLEGEDYALAKTGELESSGLQKPIEYFLSPSMGKELSMVENNEMGKKVRRYYIELEKKYLETQEWKLDRNNVKVDYREMSLALAENRAELGKETKFFHYATEADLINRIVLGMTAAQYKKHHELSPSESIRDSFTPVQLQVTHKLQKHNTSFLELGFDFEERKKLLNQIFMRKHNKQLIDEHMRLEA